LCLYAGERERKKERGGGLKPTLLVVENVIKLALITPAATLVACSLWQQQHQ